MKIKKTLSITIFVLVAVAIRLFVARVNAQTVPEKYVWEFPISKNVSGSNDLQQKLDSEVQKVITAGHLAPFRVLYGETSVRYYWTRRFETINALSIAYPFISPSIQPQVKAYLQTELQAYPVWVTSSGNQFLKANQGSRRNPDLNLADQQLVSETSSYELAYQNWPKLYAIYALWLYANNTGDWQYIDANWGSITSFYNSNRPEISKYYQSIAGAMAMARLAKLKTTPDENIAQIAKSDVQSGLLAGNSFNTLASTYSSKYFSNSDTWRVAEDARGYVFEYLSPEIARYFSESATLLNNVQDSNNVYSFAFIEKRWPLWYVAQQPTWGRFYGEGFSSNLDVRQWLMYYHAWVIKDNPQKLRLYVDTPDALIGDYYFIQNLAYTIARHGQICWKNSLTSQETCDPAPNITISPTQIMIMCPADIDQSGFVNLADYSILVANFLKIPIVDSRADINKDGRVDLKDYSILVTRFLQACN